MMNSSSINLFGQHHVAFAMNVQQCRQIVFFDPFTHTSMYP